MRTALAVAALSLWAAALGLRPGDPVAAEALWAHARETSGDALDAPVYLDAARDLARVRPWQPGFAEDRRRLAAISAARRARLAD